MGDVMTALSPMHPGEVLRLEFLEPLGMTPYRLAKELGVSRPAVNDLCRGRRSVTPRMALLLGRYFGSSAEFWLNLQAHYDLRTASEDPGILLALEGVVPYEARASETEGS